MKEFEPVKKMKLSKIFYFKYVYVLIIGLAIYLGVSYSLTFFKQNYKLAEGSLTTASVNITLDNNAQTTSVAINATGLDKTKKLEFSKSIVVDNTSSNDGYYTLNLERTSGINLSDLEYGIFVNGTIKEINDVPTDGLIYTSTIMGGETQNIEIRLWPKDSYTGSETTFVGNIILEKKALSLTGADYINSQTLTNTNNYVNFNCSGSTCEKWRIVKIEDERLVLTKEEYFGNTFTNSNLFNTGMVLNDYSLVTSMSTDNHAVYLKKTVEITDGNGTIDNPYVLTNNNYNPSDEQIIGYITYNNDSVTTTQAIYRGRTNYISQTVNDGGFQGWSSTQGGTVEYNLGDTVSFTGNTTLYAVVKVTIESIMQSNVITPATPIDFAYASSAGNGEGLYILPGTESDVNPIYYYRGAIDNNNVVFGGFCWQIVRTTETGGIKMIYNGIATGNGTTCENRAHADRIISSSAFNSQIQSVADVGYMKNTIYPYQSTAPTRGAYYGTSVEYGEYDTSNPGTNVYRLVDDGNGSVGTTRDANHHYSCDLTTATGTCTTIRYYYYEFGATYRYINLTNGETVEDALYKMTGNGDAETKTKNASYVLNTTDSKAKTEIENWFKTNLTNEVDASKTNYQEYLEDTIYCNDRSYKTVVGSNPSYKQSGWNPNGGDLTKYLFFGSNNRAYNSWYSTTNVPTTVCPNETDSFSVGSSVAHLNYPVGLLTADEIVMAGAAGNSNQSNNRYYLYTGNYYWSLSPSYFYNTYASEFRVSDGYLGYYTVDYSFGLRPVVSLKPGTEVVEGGEGTTTNPYVVKIEE